MITSLTKLPPNRIFKSARCCCSHSAECVLNSLCTWWWFRHKIFFLFPLIIFSFKALRASHLIHSFSSSWKNIVELKIHNRLETFTIGKVLEVKNISAQFWCIQLWREIAKVLNHFLSACLSAFVRDGFVHNNFSPKILCQVIISVTVRSPT